MRFRRIGPGKWVVAMLSAMLFAVPLHAQEYRYVSTSFSVTDVDTSLLLNRLGRIGIQIPFEMQGDVSAQIEIQVPINGLRDSAAYRFDGTISSDRLEIANLVLLNVQMTADYRDGVLNLLPLAFQLPDPRDDGLPPGSFRGTARMELVPEGDLSLDLELTKLPAAALNKIAGQPGLFTGGQLSGKVKGKAPAGDVQDLTAWTMNGEFTANTLAAMERILQDAAFTFTADEGKLRIQELTATVKGAQLTGVATADLTEKMSYSSDLKLEVTDVSEFLAGAELVQVEDPISATANLRGALRPFTFEAEGGATLPNTKIGPLNVTSGSLKYSVTDEQFAINDVLLKLYDGAVQGAISLPRTGKDPAALELQIEPAVSLPKLGEDIAGKVLPIEGGLVGSVNAKVAREQLIDIAAWDASAQVSIQEGMAWGLGIDRAIVQVLLQQGALSISETGLSWGQSEMNVSGQLNLKEQQAFQAEVQLRANDLSDLNRLSDDAQLPVDMKGRLTADLDVKGQLQELDWQATGAVDLQELLVDKVAVDSMKANVTATPDVLSLQSFELKLYEGNATGQGAYPLTPRGNGQFQFDWQAINVGQIAESYLESTKPVQGIFSGKATARLLPNPEDGNRKWMADASFQIPSITFGELEVGQINGTVNYDQPSLDYEITGDMFDGDLELKGELPLPAEDNPRDDQTANDENNKSPSVWALPGQGTFQLKNVQLEKFWLTAIKDPALGRLAGRLDVELAWNRESEQQPAATGSGKLSDITWNGQRLSQAFQFDVERRANEIRITKLKGTVDGSPVEGSAVWSLENEQAGLIQLTARNLNLATVISFTPMPKGVFDGRVDLAATIVRKDRWLFDVKLQSNRVLLGGVSVRSMRTLVRGSVPSTLRSGQARISSLNGSVAGGRLNGNVALSWGDRRQVDGELKFSQIDTQLLVTEVVGSKLPGDGQLSGSVLLKGKNLSAWADTRVVINADLGRAQPRRLPVMNSLQSVLSPMASAQQVDEGHLRATYTKSGLKVHSASLIGPMLEVLLTGSVAGNQRLNLNAYVRTGKRSFDRRLADMIGGKLGQRVLGLLADRLIQVRITGTLSRPVVRVIPLSLISVKALD